MPGTRKRLTTAASPSTSCNLYKTAIRALADVVLGEYVRSLAMKYRPDETGGFEAQQVIHSRYGQANCSFNNEKDTCGIGVRDTVLFWTVCRLLPRKARGKVIIPTRPVSLPIVFISIKAVEVRIISLNHPTANRQSDCGIYTHSQSPSSPDSISFENSQSRPSSPNSPPKTPQLIHPPSAIIHNHDLVPRSQVDPELEPVNPLVVPVLVAPGFVRALSTP
ncbi:uncharacterized protein EV422DRAFT_397236 [Fimicolochytrium jonesii]|uniref:uncharacterized protein n=1 Tax=Fimicolochytrium jonesii TaxID=1396493 RepID=UPI0022FEB841|nr:uncharacterized protein EV422DRAFT_397236 [Fimicolochytrium jonesii]KAI8822401.1 hypothetical protein EV422DRAFT_397236 [Fimicolochytrium jonesii]